jgi:ribonucleoside-triphosphate reductase
LVIKVIELGESCAAKLMAADEMLYPDTVVKDLPTYGNQFIPLGIKTSLKERIRIASLFDSYCNGGSIAHINIEAPFTTFEQAWDMVNYIADQGLTYFAFNTKIQACKHNHAFYGKTCPVCGEPVHTEYTRIVGFYTPIKTWSKTRKEEYAMREWENVNANQII